MQLQQHHDCLKESHALFPQKHERVIKVKNSLVSKLGNQKSYRAFLFTSQKNTERQQFCLYGSMDHTILPK